MFVVVVTVVFRFLPRLIGLSGLSAPDHARRLGRELYFSEHERGRSLAHEAIEMARRVNDPGALVQALLSRLFYTERGEDLRRQYEERYALSKEMVSSAQGIGDKAMILTGHYACAATLLLLGDRDGADREIEEYTRLAEGLRQPAFLWQAALFAAMTALLEGRVDDADRLSQEALAIGQRSEGQNALQMYGLQNYAIRREQGRVDEMEAGARGFVQQFPAAPAWRTALAFILCEVGKEDEARAEFEQLAKDDFAAIPRDGNWPIAVVLLAEICTTLGDTKRAAILYEMIRPFADVCIEVGALVECQGSGSRLLADLATTLGRWDDAVQHFEHALEMNARLRSDRWVGATQLRYGRMLLARDEPGDREKAQALVTEALSTAEKRGMKALMDRCLELKLELQGVSSTNAGNEYPTYLADYAASIEAVASLVYAEKPDLRSQAAPDGTVTILFSEIEGSTAKTEELGDQRWMDVLREHNAIVREHLAAHEGFEVKSEGDGFMLAFQSARKALQCAIETQKAFAKRAEPSDVPIQVRMGLHTGEMIKEGDDFFGKHVILAARIAAQADGGEILVSSLLRELTASGGDIDFGEPRSVELKGLAGVQEMFPISWQSA